MREGFRNSRWSLLLLIVLCAFALRVYRLGVPSLRGDEAFSAQFITQPYVKLIASLGRYEPHPPFYYTLLALWRRVAGFSEFALRFLSVLWGTLLVVLAYDYEITVSPDAPRGVYRLAVGLYDGATLERLPVRDVVCENCAVSAYASEDRVFLAVEIVVGETQSRSP